MVINQSNIAYLLTNLRANRIRCHLNSIDYIRAGNAEIDKREIMKKALQEYLSEPDNLLYRKAILPTALYDNGQCTGLIARFINDI